MKKVKENTFHTQKNTHHCQHTRTHARAHTKITRIDTLTNEHNHRTAQTAYNLIYTFIYLHTRTHKHTHLTRIDKLTDAKNHSHSTHST
jgi:hypothetical protein